MSLAQIATRQRDAAAASDALTASAAAAETNALAAPSQAQRVDLGGNRRIRILLDMVSDLSRATEPQQVQRIFGDGLVRLNGPRGYVSLSTRNLAPGEYKITRLNNEDPAEDPYRVDPWKSWNSMPVHRGGILGDIVTHGGPQVLHHLDLRCDPIVDGKLERYRSLMAVPLYENGEPIHWSIQLKAEPEGFTIQELEESILRSNLGGATVRNVMITRQLREANERISREIEQIAKIQRALLPQSLPQFPGLSIATSYETFDVAGGDLYDFSVLQPPEDGPTRFDGWLAMLVADASGHGPAAAVLSAMLNALLYAYPRRGLGPNAVFEFANKHLHSKRIEGTFITAFLAVYDPRDHTLIYSSAGHNPPLVKNAGEGGSVFRLDNASGIPLGIMDDASYENAVIRLLPGQTLVMYTDGITEAMNPQRQMFGVEGIEAALHKCSGEPACVVQSITTALRAHEAGVRPGDDQTIVAVKVV